MVIFVTARPEIIAQRIQKRDIELDNTGKTEWYGDEISKQKGASLRDAYIKFLDASGVEWVEFDTSDLGIEEMGGKLLDLMK